MNNTPTRSKSSTSTRRRTKWLSALHRGSRVACFAALLGSCSNKVESWFEADVSANPYGQELCGKHAALPSKQVINLQLHRAVSQNDEMLGAVLVELRRASRDYGIRFQLAAPRVTTTELGTVFSTTRQQLDRALEAAKLPTDTPPTTEVERTKVDAVVADTLGGPLRRFLEASAPPKPGLVHVVLVDRIVADNSAIAGNIAQVRGMSFSPQMPSSEDGEPSLQSQLHLPAHAPVIFLAGAELADLSAKEQGATALHELGHVLGLTHTTLSDNLMSLSRRSDCIAVFTDEQVERLGVGIDDLGRPPKP